LLVHLCSSLAVTQCDLSTILLVEVPLDAVSTPGWSVMSKTDFGKLVYSFLNELVCVHLTWALELFLFIVKHNFFVIDISKDSYVHKRKHERVNSYC